MDYNLYMRKRFICLCKGITEEALIDKIKNEKLDDYELLQKETNCGTGCGTCENKIRNLISKHSA